MKEKMGRPKNELDFTTCITGHRLLKIKEKTGYKHKEIATLIGRSQPAITHYEKGRTRIPDADLMAIASYLFSEYNSILAKSYGSAEDLFNYLRADEWKEYSRIMLEKLNYGATPSFSRNQLDRDFFSRIVWDVKGLDDLKLRDERKAWYDYFENKVLLPNRAKWNDYYAGYKSGKNQEWVNALEALCAARPTFFDFDLSDIKDSKQYTKFIFTANGLLGRLYAGSITPAEFHYHFGKLLKDIKLDNQTKRNSK